MKNRRSVLAADECAGDGPARTRRSTILKRCEQLLPAEWRIALRGKTAGESVVESCGPVQIRQVPGGCFVQTCAKGDLTTARRTALVRLARYADGDNYSTASLDVELPILMCQRAPGLWLVAGRLAAVGNLRAAPVPRTRKIGIVVQQPSTWAVIGSLGRLAEQTKERAEAAIWAATSGTHWSVTGAATIRIGVRSLLLPFGGGFELAVPVGRRSHDGPTTHSIRFAAQKS
jgi:hypothetical protein